MRESSSRRPRTSAFVRSARKRHMLHATPLAGKPSPATTKIEGGFRLMSTRQICMVWSAYQVGTLPKLLDVRVYWALHEIVDRREAAMRAKQRIRRDVVRFQWPRDLLVQEVQRLVRFAAPAPIRGTNRSAAVIRCSRKLLACIRFERARGRSGFPSDRLRHLWCHRSDSWHGQVLLHV